MTVNDRPAVVQRLAGYAFGGKEPRARLRALSALKVELERLEGEVAADALQAGLTWSEIGSALGVSKQAAHRRHRHSAAGPSRRRKSREGSLRAPVGRGAVVGCAPALSAGLTPKLSREAQMTLRLAQLEAAAANDREVEPDHLLVALLRFRDSALGRLVLEDRVELDDARAALRRRSERSRSSID